MALFKASLRRDWTLVKRNSFLYIFKTCQVGGGAGMSCLCAHSTTQHVKPLMWRVPYGADVCMLHLPQVVVIGLITGTLFLKGRIPTNTIQVGHSSSTAAAAVVWCSSSSSSLPRKGMGCE